MSAVLSLRAARAFLVRDAAQHASYRAALLLDLVGMGSLVVMHLFLSVLVDAAANPLMGKYAASGYFGFVLTGLALGQFVTLGVRSFAEAVRQAQLTGTLEVLFLTPVPTWQLVLFGSFWRFLYHALKVLAYLLVGALLGLPLGNANWLAVPVVLLLSVMAVAPLGMLGAAFVLVWQKGDPISYVIGLVSMLFAGVYYPVAVLPGWLQVLANLLPLTHAVECFRGVVLQGAGLWEVRGSLFALVVFSVVLGPISAVVFGKAAARAKRQGSLGTY